MRIQIMGANSIDVLRARDISQTGIGVFVPHGFEGCDVSNEVELVVTLPGRRTFLTRGVIKHVSLQGEPSTYFGVEFRRLEPAHRALIEAYVEELSTD